MEIFVVIFLKFQMQKKTDPPPQMCKYKTSRLPLEQKGRGKKTHSLHIVNINCCTGHTLTPSVHPADRNPLWFRIKFVQSRLQCFKCSIQVVVHNSEIKVVSVSPLNASTLIHSLLQIHILGEKILCESMCSRVCNETQYCALTWVTLYHKHQQISTLILTLSQ